MKLERKKFIQSLAIAIPGMVILPSFLQSCSKDDLADISWNGKVVIIGAGAAGIYAASLLLQHAPNATIEIIEASDTYGGRIKELKGFADFDIEIGAEEIHGKRSKWHDIVSSTNASLFTGGRNEVDFVMLGTNLVDEDSAMSKDAYVKAEDAIGSVINYSGAEINCEAYAISKGVDAEGLPYFNALIGNEYGANASKLSALGISAEEHLWTSGDTNYNVANRSYYSILSEKFSDAISHIRYHTQIKSIDYSQEIITLTDQLGNIYSADKVIVTVPLSILKAEDINFVPDLPAAKKDAISKIGMGNGMKIILKFNTRFWDANTGSIYGNGPVPEYWYVAKGRGNDHVLTAFIMGEKAAYLSSEGDNAINIVLADLDNMYGAGVATSSILDSHIEDWTKNPFIKGSYSFATEGGIINLRTELAASVNKKIYFAGEATHTEGHNSTVHGAIETGEKAISEIISEFVS